MEEFDKKKIRAVIASVVAAIVIIVVIALVNIIPKLGKVEVYVGYAPFVSSVKLNGEEVKNNSKTFLEEGEYTVDVSYDGFESFNGKVTVDKNTTAIYGNIVAQTEAAEKIAKEHLDDYLMIEGYFAEESAKEGEEEVKKWPIISVLPITNALYKIGYVISEDSEITLTIETINTYIDTAVSKLKNAANGVDDLAKYKIEISGFENALEGNFVANNATSPDEYIKNGFGNVLGFELTNGVTEGEYYIAKIKTGTVQRSSVATYFVIIKNENGAWKIVSKPSQIMTTYNTTNVPITILDKANSL